MLLFGGNDLLPVKIFTMVFSSLPADDIFGMNGIGYILERALLIWILRITSFLF